MNNQSNKKFPSLQQYDVCAQKLKRKEGKKKALSIWKQLFWVMLLYIDLTILFNRMSIDFVPSPLYELL